VIGKANYLPELIQGFVLFTQSSLAGIRRTEWPYEIRFLKYLRFAIIFFM